MGTLGGFPYPPAMGLRRRSRLRPHADRGRAREVRELRGQPLVAHGQDHLVLGPRRPPVQAAARLPAAGAVLAGGQPLKLKPQEARRTAVAIDRDGRFLTLVAADAPTGAQALADALVRLGFDAALMLDGGPSTQLSAALGQLRLELSGGYAVPDALIVHRR